MKPIWLLIYFALIAYSSVMFDFPYLYIILYIVIIMVYHAG